MEMLLFDRDCAEMFETLAVTERFDALESSVKARAKELIIPGDCRFVADGAMKIEVAERRNPATSREFDKLQREWAVRNMPDNIRKGLQAQAQEAFAAAQAAAPRVLVATPWYMVNGVLRTRQS